jgi:excisionase family DNA binding protein
MRTQQLIQIENITVDDLKAELLTDIKEIISNLIYDQKKDDELLSRDQAAEYLKISLVTLWNWTKNDIVPAYRIGNKVRYKKSELLASIKQSNRFKI